MKMNTNTRLHMSGQRAQLKVFQLFKNWQSPVMDSKGVPEISHTWPKNSQLFKDT